MSGPYDAVLAGFERWLERASRSFPEVARDRELLEADLASLRTLDLRLEAPLVIMLVGGTGVGKSTLLNALAGAEVAAASPVRPTTTDLICYYHASDELSIESALLTTARRVPHRRAELRGKVVLDAPDFDSAVAGNEEMLRRALALCDVVLLIATPEKYADSELYTLLGEYRRGRAFAFALNRLDLGIDRAVVEDFRAELTRAGFAHAEVFVISALAAFRAKLAAAKDGGGSRPEAIAPRPALGDFGRLEALIERELTRQRAREIKRLNLDSLVRRLFERARERLPPELPVRLERWRASAEDIARGAGERVGGPLARAIGGSEALHCDIQGRIATAYGGLFGFYQAIVWAIRGLRGRGLQPATYGFASELALPGGPRAFLANAEATPAGGNRAPGGTGSGPPAGPWPREASGSAAPAAPDSPATRAAIGGEADLMQPLASLGHGCDEAAMEAAEVALASRRIADIGPELALRAPRPFTIEEAERLVFAARAGAIRDVVEAARQAERASSGRALRVIERVAFGMPPLVVLGYSLARWLFAFARAEPLPASSWFAAALLVAVSLLALAGAAADRLARRRARRLVARLAKAARAGAERSVARPLVGRLEEALAEIEALDRTLENLRSEALALSRALAAGASGPGERTPARSEEPSKRPQTEEASSSPAR